MPLDAVCLAGVVQELGQTLVGGKIDKIYQPSRDEVVLGVRGMGENVKLLLCANPAQPRLHFTTKVRENPAQPPMFCMLLRKHLAGGRILELIQPPLERITELRIEATDELGERVQRSLVFEALGRRTNLILLGEEHRIIDCLRRVEGDIATGARGTMPGLIYHAPEPRRGLAPLLEREMVYRAGENVAEDLEEKIARLEAIVQKDGYRPTLLLRDGKALDFSFLPILQYGPAVEAQACPSFSLLLDDFYAARETADQAGQKGAELFKAVQRARERAVRRVEQQRLELLEAEQRERKRELGDLLTSNLYRMEKGMDSVRVEDFFADGMPEVSIPLDPLLTPQQNAAKSYKAYNKAKTAARVLAEQMESGRAETDYLDSVLASIALAEGERDLLEIRSELTEAGFLRRGSNTAARLKPSGKSPKSNVKCMEFRSTAGLAISVGKNNTQNDALTLKRAGKGDLWLHAQKIHGAHVILWTDGAPPDALSVTEAAQLAAWFSEGRDAGKIAVDYTPARFVKKPALARPGMVIYNTYETATVAPDAALIKKLRVK